MGVEGKTRQSLPHNEKNNQQGNASHFPDFLRLVEIHTDASNYHLRAVISKNNKPIMFYSFKLNAVQTGYTTTEKELLAIVKTLKDFKNILLGQDIKVYTDHKNITYKTHNSDRVMRWRLTIEDFSQRSLVTRT